ncbi:SGNH/GDSL hydrolase family protein [Klebsiella variicola]|uniref:SGNH/GDSL hydrolase family protein n=1 Tax=Klebsiella variicola TaxID=244366 RepID=UPI000D7509F0|nr:GDSL-type esterase/lipase family protein [Klebsiella variicola]PXK94317.1 GDSL family lipase [Klebsiella variicola]
MATTDTQQTAQFAAEASVSAAEAKQYLIEVQQGYQDISATTQEAINAATAAEAAKNSAETAEQSAATSAVASSESATAAAGSAAQAEEYKNDASEYALNKFTFYKTPSDPDGTIAGLAATTNGQSFRVAEGPEATAAFKTYENQDGVAVLQASQPGTAAITGTIREFPTLAAAQADADAGNIQPGAKCWVTSADDSSLANEYINNSGTLQPTGAISPSSKTIDNKINERLVPGDYSPQMVPLFHDSDGKVFAWLDQSRFDANDLGPVLRELVGNIPNSFAQNFLRQFDYSPAFFPAWFDRNGNVTAWFDNSKLDVAGIGPNLQGLISDLVGVNNKESFIEGDQYKFNFKRGRIANGMSASLNIGVGLDSWGEKNTIPQSIINILGGSFKDPGFISCSTRADGVMAGITLTVSNFNKYDGDNENNNAPPTYGSGPDGNAYWNNNAVGTLTWSNVTATDISLFYFDSTGSFTITIDGGAPVSINGTNSGSVKKYDITGLSATSHTVVITSSGSGVVSILCMYGKNSSKSSGVTVSRMGNGGAMAKDYLNWQDYITPIVSHFDLDLFFMILGTNDYRKSAGVDEYINGLQVIIDKYKAATPGVCICLVSPAQCNATGSPALSEYDEAMRKLALENNVNMISLYQLFPKTYDNSGGAWADSLHLSNLGAYVFARKFKNEFYQD